MLDAVDPVDDVEEPVDPQAVPQGTSPVDPPGKAARVKRNIQKMLAKGASEHDIDQYLQHVEGLKPKAAPAASSGNIDLRTQRESTHVAPGQGKAPAAENPLNVLLPVAQGLTANFADEALGAVSGANTALHGGQFGTGYTQGRDKVRAAVEQYQMKHPIGSRVAELGGALLPAVFSGGATLTGRLGLEGAGAAAAEGAAFGGLAGAGGAKELRDVPSNVAAGAAGGAILGPVVYGGGKAIKGAYNWARQMMTPAAVRAEREAPSIVAKFLGKDEGGLPAATARATSDRAVGADPLFATSGGRNMNDLAWWTANQPSTGRTVLQRALDKAKSNEVPVLDDALRGAAGVPQQSAFRAARTNSVAQKATVGPLYEKAYALPPVNDPELTKRIIAEPELAEAALRTIQGLGSKATPEEVKAAKGLSLMAQTGIVPPERVWDGSIPVRLLDKMKQSVDDMLGSMAARTEAGAVAKQGRTLGRLDADRIRGALGGVLDQLDQLAPEYAAARAAHGRFASTAGALKAGSRAIKSEPDRITAELAGDVNINPKEPFARPLALANVPDYKLGAVDQFSRKLRGTMKTEGARPTRTVLGQGTARDQLQAILGDDGMKTLSPALDYGRRVEDTYSRVTGGSSTIPNAAVNEAIDQPSLAQVEQFMIAPKRAAFNFLSKMGTSQRQQFKSALADVLGDLLSRDPTSKEGAALSARIQEVLDAESAQSITAMATKAAQRARAAGRAGGSAGGGLTRAVLLPGGSEP